MSKRPGSAGAVSSRLQRPVGWLRDRPIWIKLGLIMVVPTIATIVIGTLGLIDHVQAANNADRARTLAVLSGDAGRLVHELQNERALAIQLLSSDQSQAAAVKTGYEAQQAKTDQANNEYRFRRSTLADVPANLRQLLDRIESQLGELTQMRAQVGELDKVTVSTADFSYRVLVADLLSIRNLASQLTGDTLLTARMQAAAAVANAKEQLSQERVVVLQALTTGKLTQATRGNYIATRKGQEQALIAFRNVATQEQRELLDRTVTGPDMRESLRYEGILDSLTGEDIPAGQVPITNWDRSMVGRADRMNDVEIELNRQAQDAAVRLGEQVQRQVLAETGLLLLTLVFGVLFAWLVARSMARSLRDLRQGALSVAQFGLPQAVARLRDPSVSANQSAAQVAVQIAEPLPVRSRDEFGQVTEAFNAVHLEAVRTAAEQAALRASVATMFVNLARRSQILVDRLIGHLDRLERGEQDPDRLSELFQLDHLATRMRRNDENLLVLAGADSTRIQREPAALMDVLRAAQSEVEHYTRIEFGVVDHDIEIAAHAVNDLVHLVAELFDNATAFSPPDTAVVVEARRVGDRAVLQVEDRGIGMSPDQYAEQNERLAKPPMVDVAVSRMMGLVVVARLAGRHGVKVELRPSQERGSVADVMLPAGVLVPRALAGRTQTPVGFPASRPAPTPPPARPIFPAPLALESGPAPTPAGTGSLWPSEPGTPWAGAEAAGSWPHADTSGEWPVAGSPPAAPPSLPHPAATSLPPLPPTGSPSGLGAALAGGDFGHRPGANGTNGAAPGRNLPAWYDLTGAGEPTTNGGGGYGTEPPGGNPLPQRRPGNAWGDQPPAEESPPIPRQVPTSPEARFATEPDTSTPHGYDSPPHGYDSAPHGYEATPPGFDAFSPGRPAEAARPPVWPPVTPEPPGVDSTAEMPRVRDDVPEPTSAAPSPGFGAPTAPSRYADDLTMELPIFRELESAWFRVGGSTPPPVTPGPVAPPEPAVPRTTTPIDERIEGSDGTTAAVRPDERVTWRTAADDGWVAAQATLTPVVGGTTETGLPRRVPMAQLVPGGVEPESSTAQRRTPESVRGLLSAYHRGVQRGRTDKGQAPEPTTTGSQTTQRGKEQEA